MIAIKCAGVDCKAAVTKDKVHGQGWTVIVTYPLADGEDETYRKHLCRVCTRRIRGFFK